MKIFDITTYQRENIKKSLREPLKQFFADKKLAGQEYKKILLKPNFVVPSPIEDTSCTHPDFYMAIAELLLEFGYQVGIGESPAFGSCQKALEMHEVYQECLDKKISVVEFKKSESFESEITDVKSYQTLSIAKELQDWDALINLPKMKVHQQFVFTAASKNLYGCVVGKRKFIRHNQCANQPERFAEMILANAEKANAILHIGDGIIASHVRGPRGGTPYPMNKILLSENHLLLDSVFAKMISLEKKDCPLFAPITEEAWQTLSQQRDEIWAKYQLETLKKFRHSYRNPISFSPWQLIRSMYRSAIFKYKIRKLKT